MFTFRPNRSSKLFCVLWWICFIYRYFFLFSIQKQKKTMPFTANFFPPPFIFLFFFSQYFFLSTNSNLAIIQKKNRKKTLVSKKLVYLFPLHYKNSHSELNRRGKASRKCQEFGSWTFSTDINFTMQTQIDAVMLSHVPAYCLTFTCVYFRHYIPLSSSIGKCQWL